MARSPEQQEKARARSKLQTAKRVQERKKALRAQERLDYKERGNPRILPQS